MNCTSQCRKAQSSRCAATIFEQDPFGPDRQVFSFVCAVFSSGRSYISALVSNLAHRNLAQSTNLRRFSPQPHFPTPDTVQICANLVKRVQGQEDWTLLAWQFCLTSQQHFCRPGLVQFTTVSTTVAAKCNARTTALNISCLPLVQKCSDKVTGTALSAWTVGLSRPVIRTSLPAPTCRNLRDCRAAVLRQAGRQRA